ncbi:MAG: PPOX class F420-dependent oxidoreductase [Acidimicrobiales bacterium]|jgi:PPOX class probable F420-dependent enzyme
MPLLTPEARELLDSDALVHLVTLNDDGSPQLSCVWVGLEGDEILSGHMLHRRKVRNVERDPRVVLSLEGRGSNERGLREYLVVYGHARVQEGGAATLLQKLAHVYLGPDAVFPPPGFDAPGYVLRITPERLGGVGPWASD